MSPNTKCSVPLKKSPYPCESVNAGATIPRDIYTLLEELRALDVLNAKNWKEIYLALLRNLTELNERWKLLALIYRIVVFHSDPSTASTVVGKFLKNFDILFEKLPGHRAYFAPTQVGMWLFENLIKQGGQGEIEFRAERQTSVVQQLSLMSFLQNTPKGVKV
uniref:Tn2-11p n=1 Tax=Thermococcus nautili TaxID=195522 RepID=D6MY05_9EURY|nr:hypothetical protein [Thermococcus nautili]ADF80206.1 tn2-11p [Thermococcus nautili]